MQLLPILLVVAVTGVTSSSLPVKKRLDMRVQKGQQVPIESPGYPDIPAAGTKVTWSLTTDPDTRLLLFCEDMRISPSVNCTNGYLLINDGVKDYKYCGSESELTIRSITNEMMVEFDVNWASGVLKCSLKGVESDGSTNKPVEDNEEPDHEIKLIPGGPAYDKIYDKRINKYTNKKWRFTTTPGSRIGFHCASIILIACENSKLDIIDGNNVESVCNSRYEYYKTSTSNSLTVELKTTDWYGGRIDCLVQAVTGVQPFEYRNIISREVDSSEYGRRPGVRKTKCNCGWTAKNPARIVNGDEVSEGQYPWMVSLNFQGIHWCGGSIITSFHVLTAAHCIKNMPAHQLKVFVGTTNNTHASRGQVIQVRHIMSHNYVAQKYHFNDIAILLLAEEIKFTDRIGPICLTPKRLPLDHKFITVMGWGGHGKSKIARNPEQLLRAHMRVVDYNTCSYLWYREFDTSAPDRLCTWASDRDSCFGDSGGPLVWLDPETNRFTQVGLVSFGRGCNTDFPKVNSNVAHFYDWIQDTIKRTRPDLETCQKI